MPTSNKYFLNGLLARDTFVVNSIYEEFGPRIDNMVRSYGGTSEDAHDVFQEALIIIWRKTQKKDFELTSSFYTYLYSICYFTWQRKRKKKDNNTVTLGTLTELTDVQNIEEELETSERRKLFNDHFNKLDAACRRVLQLFFAGKKMREIAEKLKVENEHAARNRKYRCQKKLESSILADSRCRELIIRNTNDSV